MVHTSTVAFAVLALKAVSTLAAPAAQFSTDMAQREFDGQDLEARELDFEFDLEARELDLDMDLDARDFDDFEDMVEREIIEFDEDLIARATTTTTSSATATSTATGANPTVTKATTTTTTHVAKPTGKNKKETKTVVITVLHPAGKCKKLNALERAAAKLKLRFKRAKLRAEARKAKRAARKAALRKKLGLPAKATTTTASATSTTAKATSTTTGANAAKTSAASKTASADWMAITPPPKKSLAKGVQIKESKKKGKDGNTTIRRTVTAAPTPCAVLSANRSPHLAYRQRHRRDVEDMEDLMAREYVFDELD